MSSSEPELFIHSSNGRTEEVLRLIREGAALEETTLKGETALHGAVTGEYATIVLLLLDQGADANVKNLDGVTPLSLASESGSELMVHLLLDMGADVNLKTTSGDTALHRAVRWGYPTIVQLLLEKGADISSRNSSGKTAEGIASARGQDAVAMLLRAETTRREKSEAAAERHQKRLVARLEKLASSNAREREVGRLRRENKEQRGVMREMGEKLAAKEEELAREVAGGARAAKRQRGEVEVSAELGGHVTSRLVQVKQEKREVQEDLEETRENLGYVVLAENARMTQVDDLAALALAAGADPSAVQAIQSRKLC